MARLQKLTDRANNDASNEIMGLKCFLSKNTATTDNPREPPFTHSVCQDHVSMDDFYGDYGEKLWILKRVTGGRYNGYSKYFADNYCTATVTKNVQ